jgi:hypothetical protein
MSSFVARIPQNYRGWTKAKFRVRFIGRADVVGARNPARGSHHFVCHRNGGDIINPITSPSSIVRLSLSLPSQFQEPVKWSGEGGRNSGEMIARGLFRSNAAASQVMVSRPRPRMPELRRWNFSSATFDFFCFCFSIWMNLAAVHFYFYENSNGARGVRVDRILLRLRKAKCFFCLFGAVQQSSAALEEEPRKISLFSSVLL